jgi:hypothetical protein
MSRNAVVSAFFACGAMLLAPARGLAATPIDFDCDTPADHFSSVSQAANGSATVKGTILPVVLRAGNNLPLAGVRIGSPDEANSVGFRIIAPSSRAKKLDVKLITKQGEDIKEALVGQIDPKAAVEFSVSLSGSGEAMLVIAGGSFKVNFVPILVSKAMAFCSTGQFKFVNLLLPNAEGAQSSLRP